MNKPPADDPLERFRIASALKLLFRPKLRERMELFEAELSALREESATTVRRAERIDCKLGPDRAIDDLTEDLGE